MYQYRSGNYLGRGQVVRTLSLTVGLMILALVLAAGPGARRAVALGSCQSGQLYQHTLTVNTGGFARDDKPVEVKLNLTPLLAAQGGAMEREFVLCVLGRFTRDQDVAVGRSRQQLWSGWRLP